MISLIGILVGKLISHSILNIQSHTDHLNNIPHILFHFYYLFVFADLFCELKWWQEHNCYA